MDARSEELYSLHHEQVQCRIGCDHCCQNFGIFPLEFETIQQEIGGMEKVWLDLDADAEACKFLVNHRCSIYESRPIICRTHGLPLLYMNDEGWEVTMCEYNFTQTDASEFTTKNSILQDKLNSSMYMLNKAFLETATNYPQAEDELIQINRLGGN